MAFEIVSAAAACIWSECGSTRLTVSYLTVQQSVATDLTGSPMVTCVEQHVNVRMQAAYIRVRQEFSELACTPMIAICVCAQLQIQNHNLLTLHTSSMQREAKTNKELGDD